MRRERRVPVVVELAASLGVLAVGTALAIGLLAARALLDAAHAELAALADAERARLERTLGARAFGRSELAGLLAARAAARPELRYELLPPEAPARDPSVAALPLREGGRAQVRIEPRPEAARRRALGRTLPVVAVGLAAAALLLAATAAQVLRDVARPLAALERAVRRGRAGEPLEELPLERAPREIAALARALAEATRAAAEAQRARLEAERALAAAEREALLGRVAGGIAHEIGNPVASIAANVELLLRRGGLDAAARERLETVRSETRRIRAALRTLRAPAEEPAPQPRPLEAAALLEAVADRCRARAEARGVELALEPTALAVEGDPAAIEAILLELVANALAAARSSVRLRARRAEGLRGRPAARAWAALEVLDDGAGPPPGLEERIFEPFVTTKAAGEGSGIGLWQARRRARRLGGELRAGREGGWTRFSLLLPAADGKPDDAGDAAPSRR